MYLDANGKVRGNTSTKGYLAVATPGTVAGMYEIHRRYGKLPWQEVIKPAIALAKDGFTLNPQSTWRSLSAYGNRQVFSNSAAENIFTHNGKFYQPGERLIQRDLAGTLATIARNPQSFYTGTIAQAIATDMAKNGGLITLADLKAYKPIWRTPICGSFHQARICSMPPPSSGGVHLLEMLNIIGNADLKSWGWHHPDALHLMIETMKIAYSDRAEYLGDPDFVKVPVKQLISSSYAEKRRQEIKMQVARPAAEVKPGLNQLLKTKESLETSHLNVVDAERNAVSLTFTINLGFGAGVVTPGTGILLNNEMDDFAVAPGVPNAFGLVGNEANAIAPEKLPFPA